MVEITAFSYLPKASFQFVDINIAYLLPWQSLVLLGVELS